MITNKIFKMKSFPDLEYSSNDKDGAFAHFRRGNEIDEMISCREEFHWGFGSGTNFLGFCSSNSNAENINKFFAFIENKLKLGRKDRLVIDKTNLENFVRITIPKFWRECVFKRTLFTLLLRCAGSYYDGESFNKAINSYHLTRKCKNVINLFLNGYQPNYSPLYNGLVDLDDLNDGFHFVEVFGNRSEKVLKNGYLRK